MYPNYSESLEQLSVAVRRGRLAGEQLKKFNAGQLDWQTGFKKARAAGLPGVDVLTVDDMVGVLREKHTAALTLAHAQPMYWDDRTAGIVFDVARQIDPATLLSGDHLYCPGAWCWFSSPIDIPGFSNLRDEFLDRSICAISWLWAHYADEASSNQQEGVIVVFWHADNLPTTIGRRHDDLNVAHHCWLPVGASLESADSPLSLFAFQWVVAAGAFLRTKIATNESKAAERHTRKRIERIGVWDGPLDISVVLLRERERTSQRTEDRQVIEWRHQWMVRAHTRQQWYPSKSRHLPVVIAPYLKGPNDRPLKSSAARVFAVTR